MNHIKPKGLRQAQQFGKERVDDSLIERYRQVGQDERARALAQDMRQAIDRAFDAALGDRLIAAGRGKLA